MMDEAEEAPFQTHRQNATTKNAANGFTTMKVYTNGQDGKGAGYDHL